MVKILFECRYLLIPAFLVLASLSISCSFAETDTLQNKVLPGNSVILEVTTDASATSYPSGHILDMRLHENMTVEFDFYPPNTPERVGKKPTFETKKDKLNQHDYNQITSLLDSLDLSNANDYYGPIRATSVDSFVKRNVLISYKGRKKSIILEERDSHLHLNEKSDLDLYPPPLIKLLEMIDDMNRDLRKHIDSQSR